MHLNKFVALLIFCSIFSCSNNNFSEASLEYYSTIAKELHLSNQLLQEQKLEVLEDVKEESKIRTQYRPLVKAIEQTQNYSIPIIATIDSFIEQLEQANPADKRSVNTIFIKEDKGNLLKGNIIKLRSAYLNQVNDSWNDGGIKGTIFADPAKREAMLTEIEAEIPLKASFGDARGQQSWVEYTFKNMPATAAINSLLRLKNTIFQCESIISSFYAGQIGFSCCFFCYDPLNVYQVSPKYNLKLGDTLEMSLVLGEKPYKKAKFYVDGVLIPKDKDYGFPLFEAPAETVGEHKYEVMAIIEASQDTIRNSFKYEVFPQ